uniref:Terminase n=1 Tax=viral metagenome TaxID=1070528 RepID=A0A6M3LNS3_9ZZZZ
MIFEIPPDVLDYLALIDDKYDEAKKERLSRFSTEWGTWSREMNLATKGKDGLAYKYLFVYWVTMSQLLELHHISRFKAGKKRRLAKEANKYKEIILDGDGPELSEKDMKLKLFSGVVRKR